jgi:ketosteroid isomerase-like protein
MAMTDAKIATVQIVYEAFGRGDVEAILQLLSDDIDWASCPESTVAPWHGVYRGTGEVPKFFKALGESLEVTGFEPLAFTSNQTDVMVVIRFAATARATEKSAEMDIHHWWRFRDGKICFYRGTEDTVMTARMLAAD